jgi:hypothetical protein
MNNENVNLESKQPTKGTWGGARPGGGRKPGSTNKLKIADFFTPEDIDRLVVEAKLLAFGDGNTKPDKDMIRFIMEQLFGKAKQTQIYEDEDGNKMTALMVKFLDNDGKTATSNGDTNRVSQTV